MNRKEVVDWMRWLAVIPLSVSGFFLALLVGFVFMVVLDSYCPPDQIESGECIAPWYTEAFFWATCACSALAAFLVVTLAAFTAPRDERVVAWIAYTIGAGYALVPLLSSSDPDYVLPVGSALLSGLIGVWSVWRTVGREKREATTPR